MPPQPRRRGSRRSRTDTVKNTARTTIACRCKQRQVHAQYYKQLPLRVLAAHNDTNTRQINPPPLNLWRLGFGKCQRPAPVKHLAGRGYWPAARPGGNPAVAPARLRSCPRRRRLRFPAGATGRQDLMADRCRPRWILSIAGTTGVVVAADILSFYGGRRCVAVHTCSTAAAAAAHSESECCAACGY